MKPTTYTYVPGHGDTFWTWSCGWHCYRANTITGVLSKVSTRPLGHLEFLRLRTTFPTRPPRDMSNSATHLGRRAWSQEWRRWCTEDVGRRTLYTHSLPTIGECFIAASDGIHCIITTNEPEPRRLECHITNLTEVRSVPDPRIAKPRTPAKPRKTSLPFDVDSFLDDLLLTIPDDAASSDSVLPTPTPASDLFSDDIQH